MAKDPAFLFYPGDYLKDTQMLSEKSQVAYDRIMCEHMRNICITQQQLKFFTKRLNPEEVEEIKMVLTEVKGGYQIEWVAESISKRKAYSESRRKNREGKPRKTKKNISKTYVKHMENEIENEIIIKGEEENVILPFNSDKFLEYWKYWKDYKKREHKFHYKTPQSEQASAKQLATLSGGNEDNAIKIIERSMGNGWKGFFPLDEKNEKATAMDEYRKDIDRRMSEI